MLKAPAKPKKAARPSLRALKAEPLAPAYLPYARHVDDEVIALDSQACMVMFRLDGSSFETADAADINMWHQRLNTTWRNIGDERLALWTHIVRREDNFYPAGEFHSDFARGLDEKYRRRVTGTKLYINELYITLLVHPGASPADKLAKMVGVKTKPSAEAEAGRVKLLKDKARDLAQYLERYGPTQLRVYDKNGIAFSEPMEALQLILTGQKRRVPLVTGHLGNAAYTSRLIFGREAIEIRDTSGTVFGGMLGIKEYPSVTTPGLWNDLLKVNFPFVCTQSFAFLSKASSKAIMERKQNQMTQAKDRAGSQVHAINDALDELLSNNFVMGDHSFSLLVYGDDIASLDDNMSAARAKLADSGMVVAREDLAIEGAFWSQFPGNFSRRVRPGAITSRNFAALTPFHTYPAGKALDNHWGQAVALLRTSAQSPYYFNFHVADLGHTFICGPSGSGKTVVQNFMLAQLEKLGAQQVFIDKDRGADIFVRASGGTYLSLKNGAPTGFAPFKALELTPKNVVFLTALLRKLVTPNDRPLTVQEELTIADAIKALAPIPQEQRSLSALRILLGQRDAEGIGARLDKWTRGGSLGWVLDNDRDEVGLDARILGFDMTDFLDNDEVRPPIMMYLFHRIAALVDGRRLVVDVDEFWKALGDESFRTLAQDGLKTYRKLNAMMVFGTQSPADVLKSPISHTILEQCHTKIFMPNPYGSEEDYVKGFGLSREEFRLIRDELSPETRRFLVKQGHNSVVCELNLGGLDDELAVLSGRADTVELLDTIRADHGDDPAVWGPIFHAERKGLK
jgi:type IV secretion system protein VirB4